MKTIQQKGLKKLRIQTTLCLAICLFLNGAAYCGTADTTASRPRKAPVPLKLSLSGTVKGNQYQKGSTIESTQVIESGKTTYLAAEEVILSEGFEVKDGAELEVMFDRDNFFVYTFLTYNLSDNLKYDDHADVINDCKADVVSLQEVRMTAKFSHLKNKTNLDGEMKATIGTEYGIGILWNTKTVGSPLDKDQVKLSTPNDKHDKHRAYIVTEFRDFCFVATHYSLDSTHRIEMSESILNHKISKKCITSGKPVYIAGDMNSVHDEGAITLFTKTNGFRLLNSIHKVGGTYIDATRPSGSMPDLILEHNENPYRKIIDKGVPIPEEKRKDFFKNTSDHLPYRVKLKVR